METADDIKVWAKAMDEWLGEGKDKLIRGEEKCREARPWGESTNYAGED